MTSVGTVNRRSASVRSPDTTVDHRLAGRADQVVAAVIGASRSRGDLLLVIGIVGRADQLRGACHLMNDLVATNGGRSAEQLAENFRRGLTDVGVSCRGHQRREGVYSVRMSARTGVRWWSCSTARFPMNAMLSSNASSVPALFDSTAQLYVACFQMVGQY